LHASFATAAHRPISLAQGIHEAANGSGLNSEQQCHDLPFLPLY
jgi:hypothetical protein